MPSFYHKKSLGQNFLHNRKLLERISKIKKLCNENVIEIGPGSGSLTEFILRENPFKIDLLSILAFKLFIFNITLNSFYPTLPSKLIPTNFCASTANSIGNCCRTSLQNPLTINPTASSGFKPLC